MYITWKLIYCIPKTFENWFAWRNICSYSEPCENFSQLNKSWFTVIKEVKDVDLYKNMRDFDKQAYSTVDECNT